MIVLDASLMVAWLLEETALSAASELNELIERETLLVPAHWTAEIGNALTMNVRRGRLTAAKMNVLIEECSELDIILEPPVPVDRVAALADMAREQDLTFYDAAYVQLARDRAITLGTLDREMRLAAERVGVGLFPKVLPP